MRARTSTYPIEVAATQLYPVADIDTVSWAGSVLVCVLCCLLRLMMLRLTFHDRVLRLQIHLGEKQAACDAVMDSLQPDGSHNKLFHSTNTQ